MKSTASLAAEQKHWCAREHEDNKLALRLAQDLVSQISAEIDAHNDAEAQLSDSLTNLDDFRGVLDPSRNGVPPNVKLDGQYKFTDRMEELIPSGKAPSLKECKKLVIEGNMKFAAGITIKGEGLLEATEIDDKKLIDVHYGAIANRAVMTPVAELNVPPPAQEKYEAAFGDRKSVV